MDKRIKALMASNVYFGTSSWKYEGWKGLVYKRDYPSDKKFQELCLEEFAEHYPAVGVDHTFYSWPTEKGLQKYVSQTPAHFRFGMKATEEVTIWKYPKLPRYGKRAGLDNESFLNANLFRAKFLDVVRPFKERLGPIMLEFSHFYPGSISSGREFTERLGHFFKELNEPDFQLSVEMRNASWLQPPYFQMLTESRVSHVFNSWTKMPPLGEQLEKAKDFDLPSFPMRLLLRPGVKYEKAVEAFAPYDKVQEEQPELREDTAKIVLHAIRTGKPAYVFVNNRAEGSAPYTIMGVLNVLDKLRNQRAVNE